MDDLPIHAIDSEDRFEAAIEAVKKRHPVLKSEWEAMNRYERENAFTVANVTEASVIQDVLDAITRAVEDGTDFEQFKDDCYAQLVESWSGEIPGRLEVIFRTNLLTAYNEGRHAIYSSPTVKEARPYLRCDGVDDDRMCEICEEFHGVIMKQEEWAGKSPPFHFNAIAPETMISTSTGLVAASDVRPGMLVIGHSGAWRMVTASLHKTVTGKNIRTLQSDSGRILRVSDEHPVLVLSILGHLSWKVARDLKVGDQLLEHVDEVPGSKHAVAIDTKNAPPIGHQPGVAHDVLLLPDSEPVILPVDLKVDALGDKGEVHDVVAKAKLGDGPSHEQVVDESFAWGEFLCPSCRSGSVRLGEYPGHGHGIPGAHSGGNLGPSEAPRPVILSASLGNGIGFDGSNSCRGNAIPNLDAVESAPLGDHAIGQATGSLEISKALASGDVLRLDDDPQRLSVVKDSACFGYFHVSTVISIVDMPYSGELCDLSVEHDETYVAGGFIVHNCRHTLTPLSPEEAEAEGIDDAMPDAEPDEGFGDAPSKAGEDWDFDLGRFDPEVRAELEDRLSENLKARHGQVAVLAGGDHFDPNQPRDDHGMWTDEGGGGGGGKSSGEREDSGGGRGGSSPKPTGGAPKSSGHKRTKAQADVEFHIDQFEKARADAKIESAVVIDANGDMIMIKSGDETTVGFSGRDIPRLKDAHMVHNHPSGISLSIADLNIVVECESASVTAIGRDQITGEVKRYSFKRPEKGWPSKESISAATNNALAKTTEDLRIMVKYHAMTPEEAKLSHNDYFWQQVQKHLDVGYSVKASKGKKS